MGWRHAKGLLLDLDGTLIKGSSPINGAVEFMWEVEKLHIPYLYWTNNSTRTPDMVIELLHEQGFPGDVNHVYTSGIATAEWLIEHVSKTPTVYVIGEIGLKQVLQQAGIHIVEGTSDCVDAVVSGLDRQVDYIQLSSAMTHVIRGAVFIGTNSDHALPTESGVLPGAGAILAFLERATKSSAYIIGKPNPAFVVSACDRLGALPAEVVVIGDNSETDIASAVLAGAQTIWVKSGIQSTVTATADQEIASIGDLLI